MRNAFRSDPFKLKDDGSNYIPDTYMYYVPMAVVIYCYPFNFDTFKNVTFKGVVFKYSQK